MKRLFKIILFVVILLIGFGTLAVYWTFDRSLPNYNTTLELPELQKSVEIYWSSYGVPHIYASNKHDLYMAVGYVHAQDRRWQMNISQMAAEGRFAEFFGRDLLPLDKLQRTIGFWRIAQKIEEQLPDSTRTFLEAYAQGINRYVHQNKKELPVQFALAGIDPIPWTVKHSLALARLMAWELNIAWKTELTYSLLLEKLGPSRFNVLFPNAPITTNPSVSPSGDSTAIASVALPLLEQYRSYKNVRGIKGRNTGSNAWAVDGSRTNNGKPLLAGDPHLGLNIPGKWYEVHLNLNGRNLSGATLPGAPFVVLGQNDVLAWSLTNVMLDDTDFYEEQLHPQDSSRYLLDSLAGEPIYEQFITQREVIKIKNADDTLFTRELTKHGPVISDVYPAQSIPADKAITMQWTGLQPGRELEALQEMGWATSMQAFRKATEDFKVPGQNVVYADTAGNIGLFTMADIPIRSGNPLVVRPGWKPELDWQTMIPGNELPVTINPENGWVANANNAVISEDYPDYVSVYWQPESRYNRIRQYLTDNERLSTQAFQVMQFDTYSSYARSVTSLILPVLKSSPDTAFTTAINYLENWDFNYETSETAASIMDVFLLHLSENTLRDEMSNPVYKNFVAYNGKTSRIMLDLLENNTAFFDNADTPEVETKEDIVRLSMQQALSYLRNRFGDEPSEWRWGNLHTLTLRPPLFGQAANTEDASSGLRLIVNNVLDKGPYPAPGHAMSINNGEYEWNKPYKMVLGASIRRIIDLSDTGQSLSIIPGGQSGNPFSDYYGDQTTNWLNGQYKFFYHDSSRFNNYNLMKLVPEKQEQ